MRIAALRPEQGANTMSGGNRAKQISHAKQDLQELRALAQRVRSLEDRSKSKEPSSARNAVAQPPSRRTNTTDSRPSISQGRDTLLTTIQQSGFDTSSLSYMAALINPEIYSFRPPDALAQPTTLYRSVREFDLTVNFSGGSDDGKFSFAVKPILGGLDKPTHYQVGIVDTTNGWPQDFTSANTYLTTNLSMDPRVDPNLDELCYPSIGFFAGQDSNIADVAVAGNYQSVWADQTIALYNIDFELVDLSAFTVSFTTGTPHNVENARVYALQCGVYGFTCDFFNSTNLAAIGNTYFCLYSIPRTPPYVADGIWECSTSATGGYGEFTDPNVYFNVYSWPTNVQAVGQGPLGSFSGVFRADEDHYYGIGFDGPSGTNKLAYATVFPTMIPQMASASNCGNVSKLRPIAQSAWVENILPDLYSGGNIVTYSAPPQVIDSSFYGTNSTTGPYQEWQNLARNNKGILTYQGPFKTGAYAWYQPYDQNDMLLRTPTDMETYPYGGLIVSGQVVAAQPLTGNVTVGRIRIITLFEYLSDNTLFVAESCLGNTVAMESVLNFLSQQPHGYENPLHISKLGDLFKRGVKFVGDAVPYVIKGAETVGKIATLL